MSERNVFLKTDKHFMGRVEVEVNVNVLQCVAVCCSVCCSLLLSVAVCGSVVKVMRISTTETVGENKERE